MRGNTALEFGVVPEALARVSGSLHKQLAVPGDPTARPTGFASHITAGSTLPFRVGSLEKLTWKSPSTFQCLQAAVQLQWLTTDHLQDR